MPVLRFRCVMVLVITLAHSHVTRSQSDPDEWWTVRCGIAEGHAQNRAPGQNYHSPLGSSPWQVAIFAVPRTVNVQASSKSKAVVAAPLLHFICVGTIITRSIVITAASCLFNENTKKFIRPERLIVVAGKQLLSLKLERDAQKREVQIVKLIDTYEGEITSQADNIAIVVSKRQFEFNKFIQPACVDVNLEISQDELKRAFQNNTIEGAAFGLNKRVPNNGVLREAVLQFQNLTECRNRLPEESSIRSFLHYDKFCLDTPKGRLSEDTGMGLVTLVEDKYYLQGILSKNIQQEFSVVTNITEHLTWLKGAVKKVMDDMQCKNMFICANSACIDDSRKCDGFDDCGDGSDESYIECRKKPSSGVVERSSCVLPPLFIDGVFDCIGEDCTLEGGDEVGFGKSVHLSCGLGTTVPDSNPLGDYACLSSGKWSPEEPKCIRECPPLVKLHVNVTCEHNYLIVDCKEYMKVGTEAKYVCDTFYTLQAITPSARETKCLPGGRWRNEPPECIPDCGFPNPYASNSTPTIAFGKETKNVLEFPWQVALHSRNTTAEDPKWNQHCGGTLISSNLVITGRQNFCNKFIGHTPQKQPVKLATSQPRRMCWNAPLWARSKLLRLLNLQKRNNSQSQPGVPAPIRRQNAAHCLFLPDEFIKMNKDDLLVTAGKYKRDFYDMEKNQQSQGVKEAIIPAAYGGFDTRHSHDIAILELRRPFKMSSYVLPICLKFGQGFDLSRATGTVVGWGDTEQGVGHASPTLLKAVLPLVTLKDCKHIMEHATDNFQNFLTFDKFCGRFINGSGPQLGDSGGGVIVQEGPKWYLIGVVSIKDFYNTMAALTDVHVPDHQMFIWDTMKKHKKY